MLLERFGGVFCGDPTTVRVRFSCGGSKPEPSCADRRPTAPAWFSFMSWHHSFAVHSCRSLFHRTERFTRWMLTKRRTPRYQPQLSSHSALVLTSSAASWSASCGQKATQASEAILSQGDPNRHAYRRVWEKCRWQCPLDRSRLVRHHDCLARLPVRSARNPEGRTHPPAGAK